MEPQLAQGRNVLSGGRWRERGREGATPWLIFGGSVFIWILPFVVLTGILMVFGGIVGAPLLAALVVYLAYRFVLDARRRSGMVIVGYVDLAVRLNLPLVPFLRAAERSESGSRAAQIARIRTRLEAGEPLADALADARDIPDEVIARVDSADSVGQVRSALRRSTEEDRRAADELAQTPDEALYRIYLVGVIFMMFALTTFMMVFIVPKFKEIFRDFKTTLPPLTEAIIRVSSLLTGDMGPVTVLILVLLAGLALLFLSYCATRMFMPWFPMPNFRRMIDWAAWRLPIAHSFQSDDAMAETCGLLAAATRAGIPLPAALAQAVKLPVNAAFRARLEDFRRLLVAGRNPAEAADAAGLPNLMSGLLAPTSAREPDPELFSFLERYYRNRFSRARMALRGAAVPVAVLLLGTLEGTVVVGMFLPLVKLIQSVMPEGGVM
jgi:type IV pilus assembly protein PilC